MRAQKLYEDVLDDIDEIKPEAEEESGEWVPDSRFPRLLTVMFPFSAAIPEDEFRVALQAYADEWDTHSFGLEEDPSKFGIEVSDFVVTDGPWIALEFDVSYRNAFPLMFTVLAIAWKSVSVKGFIPATDGKWKYMFNSYGVQSFAGDILRGERIFKQNAIKSLAECLASFRRWDGKWVARGCPDALDAEKFIGKMKKRADMRNDWTNGFKWLRKAKCAGTKEDAYISLNRDMTLSLYKKCDGRYSETAVTPWKLEEDVPFDSVSLKRFPPDPLPAFIMFNDGVGECMKMLDFGTGHEVSTVFVTYGGRRVEAGIVHVGARRILVCAKSDPSAEAKVPFTMEEYMKYRETGTIEVEVDDEFVKSGLLLDYRFRKLLTK